MLHLRNAPPRVDVDQLQVFLAAHHSILPRGRMGERRCRTEVLREDGLKSESASPRVSRMVLAEVEFDRAPSRSSTIRRHQCGYGHPLGMRIHGLT